MMPRALALALALALLLGSARAYAQVAPAPPPAVAAAAAAALDKKDAWLVSGWRVTETRRGGGKCKYVAEARVRGPAGSTLVVIPSAGGLKPRSVPASALPAGPARAACAGAEVQVKARRSKAYELGEDEVAVDVKVGRRTKCGKFKIQLLAADGGACEVGPVYDAEGGAISDGGSGGGGSGGGGSGSGSGTKGKVLWEATYGINDDVFEGHGHFIIATADGGYLQVGDANYISDKSCSPPKDEEKLWSKWMAIKVDATGKKVFESKFAKGQCPGHALGNFALELDDSYLMCGALDYDSTFIRMDKQTGKELSRWTFDGGAKDACESVVALPGGGFAVAGYFAADDGENSFFSEGTGYLAFLNSNGELTKKVNLNPYEMAHGYRLFLNNGELILAGLSPGAGDFTYIRFSLSGDVLLSKTFNGGNPDRADHMFAADVACAGGDCDVYLAGHTTSGAAKNWDALVMKVSGSTGEAVWKRTTGNPRGFNPKWVHDECWGARATSGGGVLVVCGSGDEYKYSSCKQGDCSDNWKVWLLEYSSGGKLEWSSYYGGPYAGNGAIFQDGKWVSGQDKDLGDWAGEDVVIDDAGDAVVSVDNGGFGFLKVKGPF